ncbi:Ras-related GTP-binding protein C [Myotis brandtii]|uniref:Ras-related GTP-binding protein n=6 Tax=Yangochiroptera TaxID=30560 RepID=S7PLX5_MYOBR|nr:Ras-related GTP-binding protein C [Myotis brandtii]
MAPPPYLCISQPIHPFKDQLRQQLLVDFLTLSTPEHYSLYLCPSHSYLVPRLLTLLIFELEGSGWVRVGSSLVSRDFEDINKCWFGRVQLYRKDNQFFQMPREHLSLRWPPELQGSQESGERQCAWLGRTKVVFHKMSPNETLFLESTNKIYKDDISNSSFVNFQIWDFPGQMDFFDPTFDYEMIFRGTGALIYVIDAQDDYMEALTRLHITVSKAYKVNPDMNFEVFIHKVDGLSDDHKIETQRDIHQRANDDLADAGLEKLHLSFYLTSIYDHSIFEAFSKVVQKLIPQLPTLENLLNIFISNSGIEKAFLFDVVSKIYIATDSSPVDMQSYELCCDMIDVVIDVSCIYGLKEDGSGSAYDKESMAIIKLNNTTVLYLKEVTKFLALVCILREESFERKGLIDYNFHCFRKAIHEVFEVGVTSHRGCGHQTSVPSLKALAHNGTPRNAI